MTDKTPSPGTRSIGQTFLIGPHLYLRAFELADAASAARWHHPPFPKPVAVVEEQLKERFARGMHQEEQNQLLIACRRVDDIPVGSVELDMGGWRFARYAVFVDTLAPESQREAMLAEILELLVPWTIDERNVMTLTVSTHSGQPLVEKTVSALGGRRASRLRDMHLIDGQRRDRLTWQFFNPAWVEKLGKPHEVAEEPVERVVKVPAKPRQTLSPEKRLPGAVAVGDRVYLRPHIDGDAKSVAEWSLRETEDVFPEGRWVVNAGALESTIRSNAQSDPPKNIGLAVVLRENHEMIGVMVVFRIDWVNRNAETASEIFRAEHRSGGYGTEAKHLLLELVFDQLGLHMVTSFVSEHNPRSAAALRKQGYRLAGYTAWESFVASGLCGTWAFDLLANEWQAAREKGSRE
ncbi:MAG: GNAT family N-acetyltransferase [Thermomicrobiales bacterium]